MKFNKANKKDTLTKGKDNTKNKDLSENKQANTETKTNQKNNDVVNDIENGDTKNSNTANKDKADNFLTSILEKTNLFDFDKGTLIDKMAILDKASKAGAGLFKKGKTNSTNKTTQASDNMPLRLVFLGGGSFGTAMANLAAKNGCDSTLWVRNKRSVKAMQKSRVNKKYLPNHPLDERLKFSHDLEQSVKNKDIIFVAVPSSAFRETLQKIAPYISGQAVVSLTKGMEKDSFALMSDIINDELPEVNFGVMSGPNLAIEIMNNMPSATVIASESEPLRHAVQSALHSAFFRVFASDDVKGVELGGALKNIYAIAMGMAAAYDVGENTKAMLLTRALAEMSRFGVAVGANPLTFLGLSGVGDLYATCNSPLSRNYRVGNMLGKGLSLESAVKKLGQTAEGVNTIQQVHEKASKYGIYMPITHALYAVIFENKAALGVALNLMEVGFRSDVEFVMPHEYSNAELNAQINEIQKNINQSDKTEKNK